VGKSLGSNRTIPNTYKAIDTNKLPLWLKRSDKRPLEKIQWPLVFSRLLTDRSSNGGSCAVFLLVFDVWFRACGQSGVVRRSHPNST
jgi:hypothetical protein